MNHDMPRSATCNGTTKLGTTCRNYAKNGHSSCRHHPEQLKLPIRDHVTGKRNTDTEDPSIVAQSNGKSNLYYNAQSGTQNINSGNGNQFPEAKFEGDVKFYQTGIENCGNHYNTNNVNNKTTISEQKVPETPEEYHTYVLNYTINNLPGFQFDHEDRARKAAELLSNDIDGDFAVDRELAQKVIKLDMFDFMILCDNSYSMRNKQGVLQDTLKRLSKVANILTPKGICIRFLNTIKDGDNDYDGLSAEDIEKRFKKIEFKKGSMLGTAVDKKIVEVLTAQAQSGELKRPVIVIIITDGEPRKEPRDTLMKAIKSCKESEAIKSLGRAAVVFIVAQIGKSASATGFLHELETDKRVSGMVYCSVESLNRQHTDKGSLSPAGDAQSKANIERENMTLNPALYEALLALLLFDSDR
ncbi:hypothetical protein F5B22DRAFT_661633 [Xylaria bambusicola]|uniref:uncharacterized protein n=1 Tax=Xylaria bambusicola TaxID=326684 RepID=UPI00200834FC|nr:uncharacterized protein F5B22DRAFT_661633 [Xylaria bambusicola]KAI0505322.1 hypothetical protein F5B22DRAFT_661633 [Xylaria bambusicola]